MSSFFFLNATATTEIYTLSLHDALPICVTPSLKRAYVQTDSGKVPGCPPTSAVVRSGVIVVGKNTSALRSEEHTSELQSRFDLVCRLLLEKKKKKILQSDLALYTCVLTV